MDCERGGERCLGVGSGVGDIQHCMPLTLTVAFGLSFDVVRDLRPRVGQKRPRYPHCRRGNRRVGQSWTRNGKCMGFESENIEPHLASGLSPLFVVIGAILALYFTRVSVDSETGTEWRRTWRRCTRVVVTTYRWWIMKLMSVGR